MRFFIISPSVYFILLIMLPNIIFCKRSRENSNKKENILIVIVDDLRPLVDENIDLPNLKHLAAKGVNFKNTFAQQALCAPSRNSLLTGRRPDSLRLYDFDNYWRETVGNFTTIPQYFKEIGYNTYSAGKIFHPGRSSNFTDDYPYSWSTLPYHPPTEKYKNAAVCKDRFTNTFKANLICPVNVKKQPEDSLPDLQTLEHAIELLNSQKNSEKPFLLAVGFHKPHIPLKFPREYLKRVPIKSVELPKVPSMPAEMPIVSWHPWTDVRHRHDIHRLNISFPFGTMPAKWTRKVKQSYIAAALYIDDLIGILMRYVDTTDTIVALTSDHGWSLGENGLWAKYSNFDFALKVPLIMSIPNIAAKEIEHPVELIDLFPTLVDLTTERKIPKCKSNEKTDLCFEGKSLLPMIESNENSITEEYVAISQYPRPSVYPQSDSDKPKLKDIKIMGYSIRTKSLRYTEWISFNNTHFKSNWTNIYGKELYDHSCDPIESNNLHRDPNYTLVQHYLKQLLRSKVDSITL